MTVIMPDTTPADPNKIPFVSGVNQLSYYHSGLVGENRVGVDYTIQMDQAGLWEVDTTTSPVHITLGPVGSVHSGREFLFINVGQTNNHVRVTCDPSDKLNGVPGGSHTFSGFKTSIHLKASLAEHAGAPPANWWTIGSVPED